METTTQFRARFRFNLFPIKFSRLNLQLELAMYIWKLLITECYYRTGFLMAVSFTGC